MMNPIRRNGVKLFLASLLSANLIVVTLDSKYILPTLLLEVQLLLLLIPLGVRVLRGQFDVFEIGPFFAVLYCLYSLPLGIRMLYFENTGDLSTVTLYLLETSLGLAGFWAGYRLALGPRLVRDLPILGKTMPGRFLVAAVGFATAGTFLLYTLYEGLGGITRFLTIGYGGQLHDTLKNTGYLVYGGYLVMLAIYLVWYYYLSTKDLVWSLAFGSLFLPFLYMMVAMGNRGGLTYLLITCMAGYHYLLKKFSFRWSALLFLLGYSLAVTFAMGRYSLVQEGLGSVPQYVADNFEAGWLSPLQAGELNGPSLALYDLIDSRDHVQFLYGRSYLTFIRNILPRVLVPERKDYLAEWYVKTYYPSIAEHGGGLGFFCGAEAYVNFQLPGALIQFFIYGLALRMIYAYFRRQDHNPSAVLLYTVLVSQLFTLVRVDLAVALRAMLEWIIPAGMAVVFAVNGKYLRPTAPSGGARPADRAIQPSSMPSRATER